MKNYRSEYAWNIWRWVLCNKKSINQSKTNFTTSKTVWTRKWCHKYQL